MLLNDPVTVDHLMVRLIILCQRHKKKGIFCCGGKLGCLNVNWALSETAGVSRGDAEKIG